MSETSDENDMAAEGCFGRLYPRRGDVQRCERQVRLFGAGWTDVR
jgi:hypothetical protein